MFAMKPLPAPSFPVTKTRLSWFALTTSEAPCWVSVETAAGVAAGADAPLELADGALRGGCASALACISCVGESMRVQAKLPWSGTGCPGTSGRPSKALKSSPLVRSGLNFTVVVLEPRAKLYIIRTEEAPETVQNPLVLPLPIDVVPSEYRQSQ